MLNPDLESTYLSANDCYELFHKANVIDYIHLVMANYLMAQETLGDCKRI
jgi:hypothetical protein